VTVLGLSCRYSGAEMQQAMVPLSPVRFFHPGPENFSNRDPGFPVNPLTIGRLSDNLIV